MAPALILLAEDNRADEAVYTRVLTAAGYRTDVARDGATTLAAVRRTRPDGLLLDLNIPEIDGFEVARRLRADAVTRHIPIVAVTAYRERYAREVALTLGCRDYLTKPCDPDGLAAVFRGIVGRERVFPAPGRLEAVRILVVDDQIESMEAVMYGLEREGAEVVGLSTIAEALGVLVRFRPDVVLADLGFPAPGGDGYAFVQAVRALGGPLGTTRVVAVTGYARPADHDRALETGFDRFLSKPITPDAVVDEVLAVLGRRR